MSEYYDSAAVPVGPSQSGRLLILVFGVPSLVFWGLALWFSVPILLYVVMHAPAAIGSVNSGRALYILLVGTVAVVGATLSVRVLRRAWTGRAPVWSAVLTLGFAMFQFLLVGIIGD